ncbi:MAG TPA: hypothetical protein VHX63_14690 [Acidobacteriaceae bacterium]|jgi:hypothetical protein|nr:hypothetical protein [Acidobacteriaceae bacterium]
MYENTESWDKGVPVDLIPAIKHLRESFDDAHSGYGITTQVFCYSILHNEAVDDPAKEYINYLMHMKLRVGSVATQRFHDLTKQGTPPAIFKAFYDLYLGSVNFEALNIFKKLVEIGRANEMRLGIPHLEWAEAQTKNLIRYYAYRLEIWVRNVCDKQPYDPQEDIEERIHWRKWQAPMLLVMKPSRYMLYEAAMSWERNDTETSLRWLKHFADHYALHLEVSLKKAAGDAAVELAKEPKPMQTNTAEINSQIHAAQSAPNPRYMPSNARREARKLDTQATYKSWQKEYRILKQSNPNKSDVWYSQKISRMDIAKGSSAETIRKHMKK